MKSCGFVSTYFLPGSSDFLGSCCHVEVARQPANSVVVIFVSQTTCITGSISFMLVKNIVVISLVMAHGGGDVLILNSTYEAVIGSQPSVSTTPN